MFRNIEGIDACVGLASRAWYRVWCISPKMGSNGSSNPHGISIGLRTVRHETFEVGLGDSMVGHDVVEVMPEKNLSIFVIGLKVAASDDRDALVGSVVYVAGHGGPLGHTFDMIGHDPNMLEILVRLHVLNQDDPTTRANLKHLEIRKFVGLVTLAWGLIC
jgi:hypothetical protein